jgi:hypothetical protein
MVPLCQTCHTRAHSEGGIHFDYSPEFGWLSDASGEWVPLSVYDEVRDDPAPMTAEEILGEAKVAELDELHYLRDRMDYIIATCYAENIKHIDRGRFAEMLVGRYCISDKSVESYLTKRLNYATLPEMCACLGIANGYRIYLLSQKHPLDEVMHNFKTMPRAQFDALYGESKPRETHECPVCGGVHRVKEGH